MARPTTYNTNTVTKAQEYVENYGKHGDVIPTVEGLAEHLGIARDTVYAWAAEDSKKAFSDTLERLKMRQARMLMNGGLRGELHPTIVRLLLSKHGYSEKEKNENKSEPMIIQLVKYGKADTEE